MAGLRLLTPLFPNRYRARSKLSMSAFDAWHDDEALRRAIHFQLNRGDPVEAKNVLRAITLMCRTPTIFRPSMARFVYERYGGRGRAWDPCAGYGGRLLGATVAGVEYVGTDVEDETVRGNLEVASITGARAVVHRVRAEDFDPPRVNLVFTSPPYFDREKYSDSEEQSWKKHGTTLETWRRGFFVPVIERARAALDVGDHLVLNVADIKERGMVVPIIQSTIESATHADFLHVETLQMPLAAINRRRPTEPILVFRKR